MNMAVSCVQSNVGMLENIPLEEMTNKVSIGIDLGTTFSCVSIVEDGKVKTITNLEGCITTPSWVAFIDNEHLVGQTAQNQSIRIP